MLKAVAGCENRSCLNHWGKLLKKSHNAVLPCSKHMPLSNIIPFTQFLPSYCDFESLQPLLTYDLGLNLKSRCQKKLFGAKASTIQPFYLSPTQWRQLCNTGGTRRRCTSLAFLHWDLCPPSCLMCLSMLRPLRRKFSFYSKFIFSSLQTQFVSRQKKFCFAFQGLWSWLLPSHLLHLSHQLCTWEFSLWSVLLQGRKADKWGKVSGKKSNLNHFSSI